MDPNETRRILHIAAYRVQALDDNGAQGYPGEREELAATMSEAFIALDTWIKKGGFLPDCWQPNGT